MSSGESVLRRPTQARSNVELINSLRSNFKSAQEGHALSETTSNGANGESNGASKKSTYPPWTTQEDDTLNIPLNDFANGLAEERSQYDITVKLFYLPGIPASRRCAHTEEAISLVLKELHVDHIDLLIVSYPGISFDADDEEEEEEVEVSNDELDTMIRTWRTLEQLHKKGLISQLGVSEFGSERLAKFLAKTEIRPSVDQINVKDCCVVPKSLILYAKQEKISLLTHNDCTNILPCGTTRELLGPGPNGAGVLAATSNSHDGGLEGDIEPQWVVKYTAVVKDRGVIENKGYFALAQVGSCVEPQQP